MGTTKVQDMQEIVRWFEEGRTYAWMVEQYRTKYNLEVGPSMFGNIRRRLGLDRRITRDDALLPWEVKREHRYSWDAMMLRLEARHRAGIRELSEAEKHSLEAWKDNLEADGAVIHYDPDTQRGWFHVPPRKGVDTDLIRVPDRKTTRQPNTDDSENPG